jgi:hypothetical protein
MDGAFVIPRGPHRFLGVSSFENHISLGSQIFGSDFAESKLIFHKENGF